MIFLLVFGIWINPANISYMKNFNNGCYIGFSYRTDLFFENTTCDQVFSEMNVQAKK